MLVPVHLGGYKGDKIAPGDTQGQSGAVTGSQAAERDVMDDLVDQLAAMESKSSG